MKWILLIAVGALVIGSTALVFPDLEFATPREVPLRPGLLVPGLDASPGPPVYPPDELLASIPRVYGRVSESLHDAVGARPDAEVYSFRLRLEMGDARLKAGRYSAAIESYNQAALVFEAKWTDSIFESTREEFESAFEEVSRELEDVMTELAESPNNGGRYHAERIVQSALIPFILIREVADQPADDYWSYPARITNLGTNHYDIIRARSWMQENVAGAYPPPSTACIAGLMERYEPVHVAPTDPFISYFRSRTQHFNNDSSAIIEELLKYNLTFGAMDQAVEGIVFSMLFDWSRDPVMQQPISAENFRNAWLEYLESVNGSEQRAIGYSGMAGHFWGDISIWYDRPGWREPDIEVIQYLMPHAARFATVLRENASSPDCWTLLDLRPDFAPIEIQRASRATDDTATTDEDRGSR